VLQEGLRGGAASGGRRQAVTTRKRKKKHFLKRCRVAVFISIRFLCLRYLHTKAVLENAFFMSRD
jgi:hypothetical protein